MVTLGALIRQVLPFWSYPHDSSPKRAAFFFDLKNGESAEKQGTDHLERGGPQTVSTWSFSYFRNKGNFFPHYVYLKKETST